MSSHMNPSFWRHAAWIRTLKGFLCLAAMACATAKADLDTAFIAYQNKDYAAALKGFQELAELGQSMAQKDLAIMYMRGEGVEKDIALAYAWAMLANENNEEDSDKIVAGLKPRLSPEQLKKAGEVQAEFNQAALTKRLMPQFDGERKPDKGSCRLLKAYTPPYPQDALSSRMQGSAVAEFVVMPDGHARMPRIVYSIPPRLFNNAVRASVFRSKYEPGRFDGAVGPCMLTVYYMFHFNTGWSSDNPKFDKFLRDTKAGAEEGKMGAQMLYGFLLAGLPQLGSNRKEALPWFLKAAQAGAPLAQYQVGYSILTGMGCQCDEPKGLIWLRRAAESGQPDAQMTLAQYALRDSGSDANMMLAKNWLERAVANGHKDSKLYLAALLAASPSERFRDPQRSLSLLNEIFKDIDDDPTAYQIRAAAQAASGDFLGAVKSQKRAIAAAKQLGWFLGPDEERLARYESRQPWFGNLLPFVNAGANPGPI